MTKQQIKDILMSMRTNQNEAIVNNLLGKIDMMDEISIQEIVQKFGNNENNIRKFLENKISDKIHFSQSDEKFPINDMFTYGISGNCIHLHLPGDLHDLLNEKGFSKTIGIVNLQLLDAIDKIHSLKNNGFYRFKNQTSIYMISPILIGRELKFLESMDFKTHLYSKRDLKNDAFTETNLEAKLATHIFGREFNVGTALIDLDTISSKQWQDKKKQKVKEFADKGITLDETAKTK